MAVITDSGGITEETTILGIPCLTLRSNTERPETVDVGTNELIGNNLNLIGDAVSKIIAGNWKKGSIHEMGWQSRRKRLVSQIIKF